MTEEKEIEKVTDEKTDVQDGQKDTVKIDIAALEAEAANSTVVVENKTIIDLDEELKKTTVKAGKPIVQEIEVDEVSSEEVKPEVKDIYTADFLDSSEIDDTDLIKQAEEVTNTWFNAENLSGLIASGYQMFLPPALVGGYKKIFFAAGEWEKIEKIKDKQSKLFKEKKNWEGTESELELMDKYNTFLTFKEKKAPLTEDQTQRLAEAWEYQLNKWGFSNPKINIDKFLEAHVSILIEKGVDVGIDVAADKMK